VKTKTAQGLRAKRNRKKKEKGKAKVKSMWASTEINKD